MKNNQDFFINDDGEIYSKDKRNFEGIWIPKEIYFCRFLNPKEKFLLMEIASLSKNGKGCFASNKHLGNKSSISTGPQFVSNMISKLRKLKLISVEFKDKKNEKGKRRIIRYESLIAIERIKEIERKIQKEIDRKTPIRKVIRGGASYKKSYNTAITKVINIISNIRGVVQVSSKDDMSAPNGTGHKGFLESKKKNGEFFDESKEISSRIKKNKIVSRALKKWNGLDHVQKHPRPSKVWLAAARAINQLRKGKLIDKRWDESFLKRNNIPNSLLRHEFSEKEILRTLRKIPLFLNEGYFMRQKTFSKSLPNIIYNPYSKIQSLFLIAYTQSSPKKTEDAIEVKCKWTKTSKRLKNVLGIDFDKMNNSEKRQFNKTFDSIKELLESIPDDHPEKIDMGEFNANYLSAIKHLNLKEVSLYHFSPKSWVWEKIVKERYPFTRLERYLL